MRVHRWGVCGVAADTRAAHGCSAVCVGCVVRYVDIHSDAGVAAFVLSRIVILRVVFRVVVTPLVRWLRVLVVLVLVCCVNDVVGSTARAVVCSCDYGTCTTDDDCVMNNVDSDAGSFG